MGRLYRAIVWTGSEELTVVFHATHWDMANARVLSELQPKALIDLQTVPRSQIRRVYVPPRQPVRAISCRQEPTLEPAA